MPNPDITPEVAAQMAEYIRSTDELIGHLKQANEQLSAQVEQQQKQASQASQAAQPDATRVSAMVDHLADAKFIQENQKEAAKSAIMRDPLQLIDFLDKLAVQTVQVRPLPSLGRPVDEDTAKTAVTGEQKRASDQAYDEHFGRMAARL